MSRVETLIDQYATAVDQRIFLDLLQKVSRFQPLEGHIYIGQSGHSLADQKLIHRELGIERLLAFDERAAVKQRQMFNRPIESCRCRISTPAELADDPSSLLEEEGFEPPFSAIISLSRRPWDEVANQIREFQELISKLPEMSIVRLSINADVEEWAGSDTDPTRRRSIEEKRAAAIERLSAHIGDFLPTQSAADATSDDGFAVTIAEAFGVAASRAIRATSGQVFEPISLVQYDSESRFLSLTGIIVQQSSRGDLREKLGQGGWPFVSEGWSDVKTVLLPDLTIKERLTLDYMAGEGKHAVTARLGFDIDSATEKLGFFDNFSTFHRFYPVLLPAEV